MILISLLPILYLMVNAEQPKLISIPLKRMETGLEKLLSRGADLGLIESIYNMSRRVSTPYMLLKDGKPKPTNGTVPLFKYFDTEYYGLINIGKPGQTFKMVMDTAWAYTWVPSFDCPKIKLSCAVHNKYDHRRSSTYKADGRPFNITEKYVGYMSNDIFLVGQMNVTNQMFAELTQIPWIHALFEADGTIGLGLRDLAPETMPLFYNLYIQNKIAPIFSFYINRDPTTPRGGSLFLGGIDKSHNKSQFTTIDITSTYYWQFQMDRVSLVFSKTAKKEFCTAGCIALADTSSNTIVGPAQEIQEINQLIGAEKLFFYNRYLIPCQNEYKGPKVNFTIKGNEFQIFARDYIQKITYSGFMVCLSAFQEAEPEYPKNTWVLGGAFLYQFYTAYDVVNRQIMIAQVA